MKNSLVFTTIALMTTLFRLNLAAQDGPNLPSSPNENYRPTDPGQALSRKSILKKYIEDLKTASKLKASPIKSVKQNGDLARIEVYGGKNNWFLDFGVCNSKRYVYLIFPCQKLENPDPDFYRKLIERNQRLGLSRFEISNGNLRIVTPLRRTNDSPKKLNYAVSQILAVAQANVDLWGGQAKTEKGKVNKVSGDSKSEKGKSKKGLADTTSESSENKNDISRFFGGKFKQIGRISVASTFDAEIVGKLHLMPNKDFVLKVSDLKNKREVSVEGTYQVESARLILLLKKSDKETMRLSYVVKSMTEYQLVMKSEQEEGEEVSFSLHRGFGG